jgi:hypothetical protein
VKIVSKFGEEDEVDGTWDIAKSKRSIRMDRADSKVAMRAKGKRALRTRVILPRVRQIGALVPQHTW